ncbi:MAG TPA: protein-glutamate O-methyltransferase CheR [Longimicrobiales bacterium]
MKPWDHAVAAVRALVRQRAGLTEAGGRNVEPAMRRRMQIEGRTDAVAYASLVESDSAVFDALIHDLTVGETYFLREAEQLDYLRRHVLPALIAGRPSGAPLRVWSAGCATGEEAYTLAMLLAEAGLHDRADVIGTDIAEERLRRARHGVYGRWSFRGVPPAVERRWFSRTRDGYRAVDALRQRIRFHRLNLVDDDWSAAGIRPGSVDLLLCRNVLIYFDATTARRVAQRLVDALAPGGWLLLGASDPWLSGIMSCEALVTGAGVIYRKGKPGGNARVPLVRPAADLPYVPLDPPRADAPPSRPVVDAFDADDTRDANGDDDVVARGHDDDVARVRALADRNELDLARDACAGALERHPASAELRALDALLLTEAGHAEAAIDAARAALYLDPRHVPAHLALGSARARLGRTGEAVAAFRAAERLLARVAPDASVTAGASAAELAELARAQIRLLESRT